MTQLRRWSRWRATGLLLLCVLMAVGCLPPAAAAWQSVGSQPAATPLSGSQPAEAASTLDPPAVTSASPAPATGQGGGASGQFSGEAAAAHVQHLSGVIGPRAAGSSGSAAAGEYVARTLAALGYEVQRQTFTFPAFEQRTIALTVASAPADRSTDPEPAGPLDASALLYSASGRVAGPLVSAGFGRPEDFAGKDARGAIALMERGAAVTFKDKAEAAARAGAVGAVIFNSEPNEFSGSLQTPSAIPVVAISGQDGRALRTQIEQAGLTARLEVDAGMEQRTAENVIGTRGGSASASTSGVAVGQPRTVIVGAHFDSVPVGPGANDNASGTAVLLEMARVLADELPHVTLRFVAFGAEELGLLGSAHFVRTMPPEERAQVAAMLNFDMVGVGDAYMAGGDANLVRAIQEAGRRHSLEFGRLGSSFVNRSDQGPFIAAGMPAAFFHVWDDPHYHTAQDVAGNVSAPHLEHIGRVGVDVIRQLAVPVPAQP
jgi:aminopeptidase YwaD